MINPIVKPTAQHRIIIEGSVANVDRGENYPMPIVEVKNSRELALEALKRLKISA